MPKRISKRIAARKEKITKIAKSSNTKTIQKKASAKRRMLKGNKKVATKKQKYTKMDLGLTTNSDSNTTSSESGEKQLLELGLLLDCTGSMCSWIERAKTTLKEIISNVVQSCDGNLDVRVCFVGYRDHCDKKRFEIMPFTSDIDKVKTFISGVNATGGGDFPEDVVGGLRKCLDLKWSDNSSKQVFHIFDAPCHGRKYCSSGDDYPNGSPEGLELEPLMKEFQQKGIEFTCIKLNEECNKMIKAMQESHTGLVVTDLAQATKTKTAAEVTKMFVDSASYILRATVSGGKKKSPKKSTDKPLWNPKKLQVGDNFSCISYLNVLKIDGNQITVKNHLGGEWFITKDLLVRDSWSADHFEKEIKCNMTDLTHIM